MRPQRVRHFPQLLPRCSLPAPHDATRGNHQLGAIADYIALLALSQTESFETCQKMQSIANLLVPGCDVENRIDGLTDGDIAFLKALYRADNGGTLVAQQTAIADEMKKTLPGR